MWIRKKDYLDLVANEAASAEKARLLGIQVMAQADELRSAHKYARALVSKILLLKREGQTLGPEATEERWGSYSIETEERRQLEETAAPKKPRTEADDDLAFFEAEVAEALRH